MSELWNVSILLRPGTDVPDVRALLDARGVTLLTTRTAEDGRLEMLIVVTSTVMERIADALPAGATWRVVGVRGNLS